MDENKYLILDTRNGYKDLTGDIISITRQGHRFEVVFRENSKPFFYSTRNIHIESSPTLVKSDIEINGCIPLFTGHKLLFGRFLKIFSKNNKSQELYSENFKIRKTRMADVLNYFYTVARQIKSLPAEDFTGAVNTIVADAISEISCITVGSPLFLYLTGMTEKSSTPPSNLIFPFQCNESQLNAVEQTFSNRLSLIQGPPGTGKTQTILNILMNALLKNKSVAVVSNNNTAIQNILDKLKATEGLDFTASLLGNKENQDNFLNAQPGYPNWLKSRTILEPEFEKHLHQLQVEIKQLFVLQNTLQKKQAEKSDWELEAKKFA